MRAPMTPLKAFIHDAEKLGAGESVPSDDARLSHWLSVAQAADRLAGLTPKQRPAYVEALRDAVLPAREGRPTQIEGDGRAPTDAIGHLAERLRMEAEDMERANCFELALTTVAAVCQLLSSKQFVSARLLATAQLGRVNRQMGDLGSAIDCYRAVTDDGIKAGDGAVAAHGFIGLGNVAYARGNRPEHKRFFQMALHLAAKGSVSEMSAHQGLLLAAIALQDWAEALLHGWRAHDLAPTNSELQIGIVSNMALIAKETGFLSAALAGFDFVLQHSDNPRLTMPAIGGALRVAAENGDADAVARYEELARDTVARGGNPFDVSRLLLSTAESRFMLGHHWRVDALLDESLTLAEHYGFHEIEIRAEQLRVRSNTVDTISQRGASVWTDNEMFQHGIERLEALAAV